MCFIGVFLLLELNVYLITLLCIPAASRPQGLGAMRNTDTHRGVCLFACEGYSGFLPRPKDMLLGKFASAGEVQVSGIK